MINKRKILQHEAVERSCAKTEWIGTVYSVTFSRQKIPDSESLPRERFWDIQVPKIDSQTRRLLFPSRPASVPLRHTIASSALASQHSLKWLDGVLDTYAASPLALAHDGYAASGARLTEKTTAH